MTPVSGHTRVFAVLGHPIGHTLSPVMHNAALEALGLDAVYVAFDVAPARLMSALPAMADMGFGGVNLTVPLKEVACRGLADLDPTARILGAVNTVQFLPGGPKGYNTDGQGFLAALRDAFAAGPEGRSAFVLGSGGAGRAVAITCALSRAARVALTDADAARAQRVAAEIGHLAPGVTVETVAAEAGAWARAAREADLVVQATPVGMREGEASLLGPEAFREGQMAFDLIYMYPETVFTRAARASGARTANGLGMLLHQGAAALAIWTGKTPPADVMRRALERAVYR
jgi:shikimate dehydrogenase